MTITQTCRHAGLMSLVLLLSIQATALDCNLLKFQQQRFNLQSLELLRKAGMKFPLECFEEMTKFHFPTKILEIRQPQLATNAIYEILHGIFGILSSDLLQTGRTATLRNRFLEMLHEQMKHIEMCLIGEKITWGKKEKWTNKLRLKRYFQRIRTFLKETGNKACSWEAMHLEAWTSLTSVDVLTKRMGN